MTRRSRADVQFDAEVVPGRLDAGSATDVGGVVVPERLNLWEFRHWFQFTVEAAESVGGFGMLIEPCGTLSTGDLEVVPGGFEPADGLVKVIHLGPDARGIGRLGG